MSLNRKGLTSVQSVTPVSCCRWIRENLFILSTVCLSAPSCGRCLRTSARWAEERSRPLELFAQSHSLTLFRGFNLLLPGCKLQGEFKLRIISVVFLKFSPVCFSLNFKSTTNRAPLDCRVWVLPRSTSSICTPVLQSRNDILDQHDTFFQDLRADSVLKSR